jgi:isoleucyl-tRNA synthetase
VDYSKTLNLPKTDFPMKANLPQLEPRIQAYWEEIGLYRAAQARTRGRPKYILHDGPPYSNGDIHLGQALNKILKDIVVKFKSMQGFDSPYIPGWDNHGLPTEIRAIKTFDIDRHRIEVMELRRKCAETASHFVGVQRDQFRRLGVRGDWGRPYLTMDPAYEAAVLGVLADLVGRDCIYRGLRPVHWCWTCETALAEAEIEYQEHVSPAIYVRFPLVALPPSDLPSIDGLDAAVIIWTTTPWTLPANVAVALHPDLEYVLVRASGRHGAPGSEYFLLARPLLDSTMTAIGVTDYEVIGATRGGQLEGGAARHAFVERDSLIVLADYVTWDQGTGAVHTAPGHGREDFETGRRYHLPTLQPLDERGVFGPEGGQFAGQHHLEADGLILAELERRGALLARENLSHQYPHCWRCHQPVIFRATEQWFMAVDHFTPEALAAIEEVTWIPRWGQSRIANMVAERPDWCISRQRGWGIPIPAFYCEACGEPVLTVATVKHVQALVAAHGSDVWFQRPEAELVPAGLSCPKCGGTAFRKERDILDVWFDSGSSHAAVLEARPELASPADLYLEGSDQHRGWFQASLWTSIASRNRAPYRAVLTHGFFLDETGRKMSKSLGNIVDPQEVARRHGADILRLWVAYVDFKADMPISEDIFEQVSEGYRRLRNTIRFLLANLYDFDPATSFPRPICRRWIAGLSTASPRSSLEPPAPTRSSNSIASTTPCISSAPSI